MENDMSKTHEYFQQELGLDQKTSEAIKILMNEGLLEPLLVELRDAIEAEEFQGSNKPIGKNFDSHLEKTKEKMTPIEAELVEGSGLSLQTVREILEVT
jgi:hypothetical protein